MGIDPRFWAGRRVLLTGHTGFKGAWLTLWLEQLGARVAGYSLGIPTQPSLFELARLQGQLAHHWLADVRDLPRLTAAIAEAEPELIIHLAAQSLVRASYADPVATYATNVMGTVNLLEAARAAPSVAAVVIVTTDKCYANNERGDAFREGDPLGGHDPYSASKACAEIVTASYRASYASGAGDRPKIASVRAGNIIGGGDWSEARLIPDCIRAFQRHEPVALRYPGAVRPWQHVLEPVHGYLMLSEQLLGPNGKRFATAWNFGPDADSAATVQEVASMAASVWGAGARVSVPPDRQEPHEAAMLRLDSSAVRSALGWAPRWTLEQGLRATMAWYRAWGDGADMRDYSRRQLGDFLAG